MILALLAAIAGGPAAPGVPAERPNVIVILTDDQGSADAGPYGAKDLATPAIDALAARGVRFTRFYSAAPVCSPSRAALLTGRHPIRCGVTGNCASQRGGKEGLPPDEVTMAEMFRAAGYATAHVGKWHLGYTPEMSPAAQGFDRSFGHMGGCIDNWSHFFYWQGPNVHDLWRDGAEVFEPGRFFADIMVEAAGRFLEENRERPFFLYFALNLPHYPYQPDPKHLARFEDLPYPRNLYAAFLATMDERIGALMAKVDALRLRERTIIVFQSDNGHSTEERAGGGGGSSGGLRGAKFSLFEGGIRVPAIISWPRALPEGAARAQIAHACDWLPTLAELCGVNLPGASMDGASLVPVLRSSEAPSPHGVLHWQWGDGKDVQWAVREGDWKLIGNAWDTTGRDTGKERIPLFLADLAADPGETRDRSAERPDIAERLRKLHEEWERSALRPGGAPAGKTAVAPPASAPGRPNILWLTCEDINPHLGCYGDPVARTPAIDRFAASGTMYLNCWSNAPVCAPARTAIITGVHPTSLGAENMRSLVRLPPGMKMFPQILREAGYYCTNNSKEDYNAEKPGKVWDESSPRAHWRNRAPGHPFFAVFNHEMSHESRIRARPHALVHDPAAVRVPPYHPEAPEVRRDWAQYYDGIAAVDSAISKRLEEIEEAGLAEDTIVFFFGDNGSGMPRSKRNACDSGLHVPLIVRIPEKHRGLAPADCRPGGKTDRLVSFVDLAPTVLGLAGVRPPESMQGRAFLGPWEGPLEAYIHGYRARMDERYDLVRAVRDACYVYVRNYMPHLPQGQHVEYMFETPTTRIWKEMFDAGKLNPVQARFWMSKEPEELYDLREDPYEVRNLASSPEHRDVLERLRKAQRDHALAIRDLGFLPECDVAARAGGRSPYELGHDPSLPLERIMAAAEAASMPTADSLPALKTMMGDPEDAVRWWAAIGILLRGKAAVDGAAAELRAALDDPSAGVRIAAAEALGRFGADADSSRALEILLKLASWEERGVAAALMALNAIEAMGTRAAPASERVRALPRGPSGDRAGVKIDALIRRIAPSPPGTGEEAPK